MKILNGRPRGMGFDKYRKHLLAQKEYINGRIYRPFLVVTSPPLSTFEHLKARAKNSNQ